MNRFLAVALFPLSIPAWLAYGCYAAWCCWKPVDASALNAALERRRQERGPGYVGCD